MSSLPSADFGGFIFPLGIKDAERKIRRISCFVFFFKADDSDYRDSGEAPERGAGKV